MNWGSSVNNFAQYGAEMIQEQVQNRGSIFQIRKQKIRLCKLVSHVSNVRSYEKFRERRGTWLTPFLCARCPGKAGYCWSHMVSKGSFMAWKKKRWYCKYLFSPCHIACSRYIVRTFFLAHITWSCIFIRLSIEWNSLTAGNLSWRLFY